MWELPDRNSTPIAYAPKLIAKLSLWVLIFSVFVLDPELAG
jgi:hypothetical protein